MPLKLFQSSSVSVVHESEGEREKRSRALARANVIFASLKLSKLTGSLSLTLSVPLYSSLLWASDPTDPPLNERVFRNHIHHQHIKFWSQTSGQVKSPFPSAPGDPRSKNIKRGSIQTGFADELIDRRHTSYFLLILFVPSLLHPFLFNKFNN